MKNRSIPLFTLTILLLPPTLCHAEILGYQFNETGTSANATGSAAAGGNPQLNFTANGGAAADLHGGPGSGVSGQSDDRAFDNSASTGIIGASHGQNAADFDPIDGLNAFTLSGWFRLPSSLTESIGRQMSLIENGTVSVNDDPGGFRLRGGSTANAGTLELTVNRDDRVESSAAFTPVGEWVNFAVTYDGLSTTDNVKFYVGSTSTPLALVDTLTLDSGPVLGESIPLTLGVTQTSGLTLGAFPGLLDSIRIYGEVASLGTLENARLADIRQVPEPSGWVLALVAAVSLLVIRRRK